MHEYAYVCLCVRVYVWNVVNETKPKNYMMLWHMEWAQPTSQTIFPKVPRVQWRLMNFHNFFSIALTVDVLIFSVIFLIHLRHPPKKKKHPHTQYEADECIPLNSFSTWNSVHICKCIAFLKHTCTQTYLNENKNKIAPKW